MELANCKKCGRMFSSYDGEKFCSKCRVDDTDDFKKVRDYLYDNPGADIRIVAQDTGVDEKKILKFLKQERLEIREGGNALLNCERCGRSIKCGRYCEKCKQEVLGELGNAATALKNENKTSQKIYHATKLNNPKK